VGPVDTGYLRFKDINRCVHRDFQNIGVDGARSSAMADNIIKTMARNQTADSPAFVTYALIGNDVCDWEHGYNSFTQPSDFYQHVVKATDYLDTVLPMGSHVVFLGLVDGRILYDTMSERVHPIGSTDNNVLYKTFYDYLNCLFISPCFGWMNSDEFWRNATTQRAMELNQMFKLVIANHTYKHFDMHYYDDPMEQVVQIWNDQGGETWQLIEPVDGFHPSQITQALITEALWPTYQAYGLLPPKNPNNALIDKLFGDQGGYYPHFSVPHLKKRPVF